MENIHFETVVKDGYIKIPDEYSRLNNKRVLVEIVKENRKRQIGRGDMKAFVAKYRGLLKGKNIPEDIDIKEVRHTRLKEKYDL